ncbi:RNA pyrophosphohydrolase [Granulosicoccus sp. 3-233]|uniref:RNA pyrophosphohydrolase n=1 Tax=Granulosicoccus sp. 3-233 TaxID=3417969 RepID=UPI003D331253
MSPEEIDRLPYRPCVGLMMLNSRGLVFVGQRIDTPQPAWQMPQGGIDEGETPREAALRELGEETGLPAESVEILAESADWLPYELPVERVPHIWGGRYRGQQQKWFLLRFIGEDQQISIDTDVPEFNQWRWLPSQELVQHAVAFKRDVYAAVVREFSAYL